MTGTFQAIIIKRGIAKADADEIAAWVNERKAFLESRGFSVDMKFVETLVSVYE